MAGHRPRHRPALALVAAGVVVLGLSSRRAFSPFPLMLGNYPGDMLWALLVFVLVAIVVPRVSTPTLACVTALISCAVEFSQLYHAPWVDAVRGTMLGHLVLGNGFDGLDLLAYAVGIAIGCALDARLLVRRGVRGLSAPAGGGSCGAGCTPSRRWRDADRPQGDEGVSDAASIGLTRRP